MQEGKNQVAGGSMTTNHKELCEWLRSIQTKYADKCADTIEQQAARIAELHRELEATRQERNAAGVKARRELMPAYEARIAELEKERDALKSDAERWRIIEFTLPTDEIQDIAIIVAAEHSVNVANGFAKAPADLLDAAVAALQAEKETKS